ncbi:MAG: DNA-binding protein, partial [Desulfopila sp.]|nr:DNA-binding protein [Desulfopila sp.]
MILQQSIRYPFFHYLFVMMLLFMAASNGVAEEISVESGTVLQTIDASPYTYLNIKTARDTVWVAIPAAEVQTGEDVSFIQGMVMNDFYSKTLDRTFDSVIFSPGLQQESAPPHPGKHNTAQNSASSFADAVKKESQQPSATMHSQAQHSAGSAGAIVPFMEVAVEKASGENGYRVEEIFSKAESLDGTEVRVRGKVVKVSPNIMGKNWIHIQDGSGDPMHNSHDLVVTSTDTAEVEAVILVQGTLAAKKDFGFGYSYEAIIE